MSPVTRRKFLLVSAGALALMAAGPAKRKYGDLSYGSGTYGK